MQLSFSYQTVSNYVTILSLYIIYAYIYVYIYIKFYQTMFTIHFHGKSPDRKFYCIACCMLLSKNCVERDYSLISLVLAMVKLVNMSCHKILNEVSFVSDKM